MIGPKACPSGGKAPSPCPSHPGVTYNWYRMVVFPALSSPTMIALYSGGTGVKGRVRAERDDQGTVRPTGHPRKETSVPRRWGTFPKVPFPLPAENKTKRSERRTGFSPAGPGHRRRSRTAEPHLPHSTFPENGLSEGSSSFWACQGSGGRAEPEITTARNWRRRYPEKGGSLSPASRGAPKPRPARNRRGGDRGYCAAGEESPRRTLPAPGLPAPETPEPGSPR